MKIGTTDQFRLSAAVLRHAATGLGLHAGCRIRKCRRDGGCTGPLLRHDAGTARFVAARPGDAVGETAPLCCLALDPAGRGRVASLAARILGRLEAAPRVRFPEDTRAMAARDWSAFSLADGTARQAELLPFANETL